jgi:AraC-like DNA-binding protein
MDPLSDILGEVAVERAIPLRFESRGPYAMRFGPYEHLKFGAVLSGAFRLWIDGEPAPLSLGPGDCYLLTDGRSYRTFVGEGQPEMDGTAYFEAHRDRDGVVRLGESPPDKVVIGGRFVFEHEGARWLRQALPGVVCIRAEAPEAAPLRATLSLMGAETGVGAPGRGVIFDRLADILLVQAIRAYLATAPSEVSNWLAGVADPQIGRALRAFHADVARNWRIASLAAEAGMSRSVFAERFRARVGLSPLDYLTRWRLYRVRRAMIETDEPFAAIAARNGYRSRTSCSQAFARRYGAPPGAWRAHEADRRDSAAA